MFKNLEQLFQKIKKQRNKDPKISYTASLMKKGNNFCIKKFMEEAKELAASAKYSNKKYIIQEAADLLYHFLVLLEFKKTSMISVMNELKKRQKISGIQEKKNRSKNVR
jgi:phosphoribosyl-ATP pyrophosphohydrolase